MNELGKECALMLRRVVATIPALFAIACGGSEGSGSPLLTPAGSSPQEFATAIADYCEGSATATCAGLANCCGLESSECHAGVQKRCLDSFKDAYLEGIRFDEDAGRACYTASESVIENCSYVASATEQYQRALSACRVLAKGTVAIGAPCSTSAVCLPPSGAAATCTPDLAGENRCTAVALVELGEECGGPGVAFCAPGHYCDKSDQTAHCAKLKPSGQSCEVAAECLSQICSLGACAEPTIELACRGLSLD